jgi:hypothetical protein
MLNACAATLLAAPRATTPIANAAMMFARAAKAK